MGPNQNQSESIAFVLTGGGARAAYQLGVLKYVFTKLGAEPKSPIFIGTSAGGINATYLAMNAHRGYKQAILDLCELWEGLTVDRIYKTDPWSILKTLWSFLFNFTFGRLVKHRHIESILDSTPLYLFLRENFNGQFHHLRENIESGVVRAIGITVMQFGTGDSITFYEADPHSTIHPWVRPRREGRPTRLRLKHVLASAAIPLIFPSVKLENHYYGDGSVRRMAPLSPAIQLGASKIFAIGLRTSVYQNRPTEFYPSVSQIMGIMFNTLFLDALDHDVHTLERVNRIVERLGGKAEGLRKIDVKLVRPSTDLGLLSLPFKRFIPKTLSFFLKGFGHTDVSGADFLSYMLFDGHYTKTLIERGFRDAEAQHHELEAFFCSIPKKKVA